MKATKGIKRGCAFNNLQFFHIIDNMSADIMHDVNEVAVAYCLHDFFNAIIDKKICSAVDIQKRARDFNYSHGDSKNKPSLIVFEKHNLNQSASQMFCLMKNLPFMFFDLKNSIGEY